MNEKEYQVSDQPGRDVRISFKEIKTNGGTTPIVVIKILKPEPPTVQYVTIDKLIGWAKRMIDEGRITYDEFIKQLMEHNEEGGK